MSTFLPTPPASPPASYETEPTPPPAGLLPVPPRAGDSPEVAADRRGKLAEYYWSRHFENGPLDPAPFLDRLFTDYATYEGNVVGEWLDNMSPPYKLYKKCLVHCIKNGSPDEQISARTYQKVTSDRER